MSEKPEQPTLNQTSVVGKITWLQYYLDRKKVVFTIENESGVFYIEWNVPTQPTFYPGCTVLVLGTLFSRHRKGHRDTGIQAKMVSILTT